MNETSNVLKERKVLDHGFVELIDVMGSDQAIVNAARTSYDKGTKKVSSTRQLIRYLMRHQHMGPFEFAEVVFRIRCPLFVARQWFRHRMASYNEASLRYSEARDEFYVPNPEWITGQDLRNKQARTSQELAFSQEIHDKMQQESLHNLQSYNEFIEKGVAREIARINIPLSYYTTFCFKADLRNLMHFFSLRTDTHAQFEIRQYANCMVEMIEEYFPNTLEAWRNYDKNSIKFTAIELDMLKTILEEKNLDLNQEIQAKFSNPSDSSTLSKNEQQEFLDKILKLHGKDVGLNYLGKNANLEA